VNKGNHLKDFGIGGRVILQRHEGVWRSGCIDPRFLESAVVGGE
jgi:hypothetical protein